MTLLFPLRPFYPFVASSFLPSLLPRTRFITCCKTTKSLAFPLIHCLKPTHNFLLLSISPLCNCVWFASLYANTFRVIQGQFQVIVPWRSNLYFPYRLINLMRVPPSQSHTVRRICLSESIWIVYIWIYFIIQSIIHYMIIFSNSITTLYPPEPCIKLLQSLINRGKSRTNKLFACLFHSYRLIRMFNTLTPVT